MGDDQAFRTLQSFVGRDLVDMRKPGLYRNRSGKDFFLAVADSWMKFRTGVSSTDTMAKLESLKTPLTD